MQLIHCVYEIEDLGPTCYLKEFFGFVSCELHLLKFWSSWACLLSDLLSDTDPELLPYCALILPPVCHVLSEPYAFSYTVSSVWNSLLP